MIKIGMLLLYVVIVLPLVMFAARVVGAERKGFGSALLATFLLAVISILTSKFALNQWLSTIISIPMFSFVLGTTFLRGVLIVLLLTVIFVLIYFVIIFSLPFIAPELFKSIIEAVLQNPPPSR
jgi:hypothetical protein